MASFTLAAIEETQIDNEWRAIREQWPKRWKKNRSTGSSAEQILREFLENVSISPEKRLQRKCVIKSIVSTRMDCNSQQMFTQTPNSRPNQTCWQSTSIQLTTESIITSKIHALLIVQTRWRDERFTIHVCLRNLLRFAFGYFANRRLMANTRKNIKSKASVLIDWSMLGASARRVMGKALHNPEAIGSSFNRFSIAKPNICPFRCVASTIDRSLSVMTSSPALQNKFQILISFEQLEILEKKTDLQQVSVVISVGRHEFQIWWTLGRFGTAWPVWIDRHVLLWIVIICRPRQQIVGDRGSFVVDSNKEWRSLPKIQTAVASKTTSLSTIWHKHRCPAESLLGFASKHSPSNRNDRNTFRGVLFIFDRCLLFLAQNPTTNQTFYEKRRHSIYACTFDCVSCSSQVRLGIT